MCVYSVALAVTKVAGAGDNERKFFSKFREIVSNLSHDLSRASSRSLCGCITTTVAAVVVVSSVGVRRTDFFNGMRITSVSFFETYFVLVMFVCEFELIPFVMMVCCDFVSALPASLTVAVAAAVGADATTTFGVPTSMTVLVTVIVAAAVADSDFVRCLL